jgi:hypothetical protein
MAYNLKQLTSKINALCLIFAISFSFCSNAKLSQAQEVVIDIGNQCLVYLMQAMPSNFCWKKGYAGVLPNDCPEGYFRSAALCYKNCGDGYYFFGGVCYTRCRQEYKDI